MKNEKISSNEKHSIYYNDIAQEVIKKFIKKRKRVRNILLFIMAVNILIYLFCTGKNVILFLVVCFFIVLISKISRFASTNSLTDILMVDCDPVKMYEVANYLETIQKKESGRNLIYLVKAQSCRYIKGKLDEGFECLKRVNYKKKKISREANILNEFLNYAYEKKDRELFYIMADNLKRLPSLFPKCNNFEKDFYDKIMLYLRWKEVLWDGTNEEIRRLANEMSTIKNDMLNQIMLHMHLAEIDIKESEYKNACMHLEYVIAHGNTMSVVDKAKEMMMAMQISDRHEDSEGQLEEK